jgi:tRNA-Thr(GGU) m(6)t(6)A37 methyltransferase TsaA
MRKIAEIHSDFDEKFGIPRQSGLIEELKAEIIFEPGFRDPNCFAGLEDYTHIWLLWEFSGNPKGKWSPKVLPPRLGGKKHMGVFATRSPFRPNPIGLSCVKLDCIEMREHTGPVLHVSGADLLNGTPIYDIKPYISYTDCHPDAVSGFAEAVKEYALEVVFPEELLRILPEDKRAAAVRILEQDPRPAYQNDPERRYGTAYAGYDIRFHVREGVLTVCEVVPYRKKPSGPGSLGVSGTARQDE